MPRSSTSGYDAGGMHELEQNARRPVRAAPAAVVCCAALAISAVRAAPHGEAASDGRSPAQAAGIDGTITVSIASPTLKHWGVPGAEAAFVADSDQSLLARALRESSSEEALCAAIGRAAARDSAGTATADGDGRLDHRSGDEMRLSFSITVPGIAAATPGMLWVCTRPIVAYVSRGSYPQERFERAGVRRLSWKARRVTLRPGERARVSLTASVDASEW